MIRIAIVEDEQSYVDQFTEYLGRFERESGNRLSITVFRDGDQILSGYRPVYDIILMDIQMRLMDGMTTAEYIRRQDQEVMIIFITNLAQYAIRGYAVDALDYVLKPVNYFAFSQRLDRAIKRLKRKEGVSLVVNTKGSNQRLLSSQLYYVESQGHTLIYHTRDGNLTATGALKEVEAALSAANFSRCNKGYLVNLEYVDAVRDGAAIVNGEALLISRGKKKEFMEELARCLGGNG